MSMLLAQSDEPRTLEYAIRNMVNKMIGVLSEERDLRITSNQNDKLFELQEELTDTIESLRDRLQDADVAYNDAEVLGDVTQGVFRDLMAADPDTAKTWARSWPELFGEKEVDA